MEQLLIYDNTILNFIQEFRSPLLDRIMPIITCLGNFGFIWIVITVLAVISKRYRKLGFTLTLTLSICVLIGNLWFKPFVERIRPFEANHFTNLLITAPKDFSFPSGHAMASFACTTVLLYFDKKAGIPALLITILISFSRLYLYVHYPSDIFGGMVIGIVIGIFTYNFIRPVKVKKKHHYYF